MTAQSGESNKSVTHRLTMLYIVALSLTALLAILGEVLLHREVLNDRTMRW
ncbi:MAG: hypothetical protein ACR2H4_13590 [Pyrinomonadaceae bacterium]